MKWVGRRLGQGVVEGILLAIRDFLKQLLASQDREDKKDIVKKDPINIKQESHDILKGRR